MNDQTFYRRNLPHWQPDNSIFFITFRLAHSLPADVISQLEDDRKQGNEYKLIKDWQAYDEWLDRCKADGPLWLTRQEVAGIVADEINRLDGQRFTLLAYCIMPNHVHLMIDTSGFEELSNPDQPARNHRHPLTDSLRLLKGRTSRYCNQKIGRTGRFWHSESYDHVVRDEQDFQRVLFYIANNPVKAGLVSDWEQWPYTYIQAGLW